MMRIQKVYGFHGLNYKIIVRLVAWYRESLVRLRLVCDSAFCFAASDLALLLLRVTTVAACARVL